MNKRTNSGALRHKQVALAVAAAFLPWGQALALPTGEQVVAGQVTVSRPTPQMMQVDQGTQKGIVNWQGFSIGASEHVNFTQPSASSVTLNRVMGTDPSAIFGRLSANGQIFLTNPAGVLFAPGSAVDVGSLFATTLSIQDQDFLAGRYLFSNSGGAGSVVNQGNINIITANGYAALSGPQVRNDGVIVARTGTVALAAGDQVSLDMVGDRLISISVDQAALNASVINTGTIDADGSTVLLTARSANALLDTVVNNSGVIRANSLIERNGEIILDGGSAGVVNNGGTLQAAGIDASTTGGTIRVLGDKVSVVGTASIDASGNAGGGTVQVNASATYFGAATAIHANALDAGDGGRVVLSSSDATRAYGAISARGAAGGTGGFVETSGGYLELARAPDVGAGGTWLIDPYNIQVVDGVGTVSNTGTPTFTPNGDDSQIGATLISDQLNAGTNVVVDTGGAGSPGAQAGDIRIQAPINKTAANGASLTLKAFHDVEVNQDIAVASGPGGTPGAFGILTIDAGHDVVVAAPITTSGGGLVITASSFTNRSAIDNSVVGGQNLGMVIAADAFNLAGGTINGGQGSVGLFTRTGSNSFGIESPGNTTVTNADIASITTSVDVPGANANQLLFGIGFTPPGTSPTPSTGTMTIGANAQVIGGAKNLMFFGSRDTGTTITIGANGLSTTGDVTVDAGAGAIGGTGTIGGNQIQLIASRGIGASTARVGTAAGTLAVRTPSGGAFISEADDVTLATVVLAGRAISNNVGGAYDLTANGDVLVSAPVSASGAMNLDVGGSLNLVAGGGQNAVLSSGGKQTVTAANITLQGALVGNNGGAFISNSGGGGDQEINVAGGTISIAAGAVGLANRAFISSNGNQTINGDPNIVITGGASGTGTAILNTSNGAGINTNGVGKVQTIHAGSITLNAGSGGNETFAVINGANQVITASGDVLITGGDGTGIVLARIGGATTGPTNLMLNARDVILTGGSAAGGEAGLGSTMLGVGASQPNTITVNATRDVILNSGAGSGARIGTGQIFATPAGGDIAVNAGNSIQLNGTTQPTAIRTTGNVTLNAASISEASNGFIVAGGLNTTSSGNTTLTGPNQVSSFNASSGGDVSLNNTGALTVTGLNAGGNAALTNVGNVTLSGPWTATGTTTIAVGSDIVLDSLLTSTNVVLNAAGGTITETSGGAIVANSLATTSSGDTTLTGPNQIASLDVPLVFSTPGVLGNFSLNNTGALSISNLRAGGSVTLANTGAVSLNASGTQDVFLTSVGGQTISADSLSVTAQDGRRAIISNVGGPGQSITTGAGGIDLNVVAGAGVAQIANNAGSGTQTIQTTGTLSVVGGSAAPSINSGVFQNQSGKQTVTAANITLRGATGGNNGSAFIVNTGGGGDQEINVAGGTISIAAGAVGLANRAFIASNGNQTINGDPNIVITGGASGTGTAESGTSNAAGISANGAGKVQTIHAGTITLNAGLGGNDTYAHISGANQVIAASGDVLLTGGDGTGIAIARIGGIGVPFVPSSPTNLMLNARDVILTGGSAAGGKAGLGSTVLGAAQPNTITVNASRDVILNSGSGSGARIGTSFNFPAPVGGDIAINAGNSIQLNGTTQPTAIRTTGNVTLNAASISETGSGAIVAGGLNTTSIGSTGLVGPNQVSSFTGSSGGDLSLTNTGALTISGNVSAGGTLHLDVAGSLAIVASGTQDAFVSSSGGQDIHAQSMSVTAQDGRIASLQNSGGNQTITVTGDSASGGIDVQVLAGGGFAQIGNSSPGGYQTIAVTNADHINVNGVSGPAAIFGFGGTQDISIIGSGANAITVGSSGALGSSNIGGGIVQNVTAGLPGESGSITIVGPASNGVLAGILTSPPMGGTQTIATSGLIDITGGNAPNQAGNFASGIFHNGSGAQSVSAAGISLTGGPDGRGNTAQIGSFGGGVPANAGHQLIHVDGGAITVRGSDTGINNRASLFSNADQTIDGSPNIAVLGGASGGAANLGNTAGISTAVGRTQTIQAGTIDVISGAGGIDATAFITGGTQVITTTGDFYLTGGGSAGTLGAARIGGPGGAVAAPTNLTLNVGGDLVVAGGSAANDFASIGSSGIGGVQPTNTIAISAGGSVILNSGTGAGARIGTSVLTPPAGGDISISAGGSIQLNGTAQPAAVRTTGNVTLNAASISEASNGFIVAGGLNTTSSGSTSLTGPNQVGSFSGTSLGDLSLNNTSAMLIVPSIQTNGGALAVMQTGDLNVTGMVTSGAQNIDVSGTFAVLGATGPAEIRASGPVNISTGNDLRVAGGSGDGAHALLFADSNINLTVGGFLTINAGSGNDAWARAQTATRDSAISIHFPNLGSGGYFVNDVEGAIRRGQTGFLSGMGAAAPDQNLIVTYGE